MNASRIITKAGLLLVAAQISAALALWAAPPVSTTRAANPHAPAQIDESRQTLILVNQARTEKGLAPLEWDEGLAKAAQEHALLLAQNHGLSHQFAGEPPLDRRISAADVRVGRSGENVAVNYNSAGAHVAFMQSPEHQANILNPEFDALGIAVVRDGDLLYFVEDFAHRRPVLSSSESARLILHRFAEVRGRAGAPPLRDTYENDLQAWACPAVRDDNDRVTLSEQTAASGAKLVLAFSASSPDNMPPELLRVVADPAIDHYSVGVCYTETDRYPAGRYFVAIAFFETGSPLIQQAVAADPTAISSQAQSVESSNRGHQQHAE